MTPCFCQDPLTRYPCCARLFILWYVMLPQQPIPAEDSWTSEVIRPEDYSELITYITMNNLIQQSYLVNEPFTDENMKELTS